MNINQIISNGSLSSLRSANIPTNAEPNFKSGITNANFVSKTGIDWRVKLSVPISNYTIQMPNDVDYIASNITTGAAMAPNPTYVPVKSQFNIIYNRHNELL